jgi:hypothetical protein
MDIESVVQYNTDMVLNACMQVPIQVQVQYNKYYTIFSPAACPAHNCNITEDYNYTTLFPVAFTDTFESKTVHLPQHRLILGSKTAASMNRQTVWQIPHLDHQKEFGNHLTDYHCSYHISLSTETVKEYFRLYIAQPVSEIMDTGLPGIHSFIHSFIHLFHIHKLEPMFKLHIS